MEFVASVIEIIIVGFLVNVAASVLSTGGQRRLERWRKEPLKLYLAMGGLLALAIICLFAARHAATSRVKLEPITISIPVPHFSASTYTLVLAMPIQHAVILTVGMFLVSLAHGFTESVAIEQKLNRPGKELRPNRRFAAAFDRVVQTFSLMLAPIGLYKALLSARSANDTMFTAFNIALAIDYGVYTLLRVRRLGERELGAIDILAGTLVFVITVFVIAL